MAAVVKPTLAAAQKARRVGSFGTFAAQITSGRFEVSQPFAARCMNW